MSEQEAPRCPGCGGPLVWVDPSRFPFLLYGYWTHRSLVDAGVCRRGKK